MSVKVQNTTIRTPIWLFGTLVRPGMSANINRPESKIKNHKFYGVKFMITGNTNAAKGKAKAPEGGQGSEAGKE